MPNMKGLALSVMWRLFGPSIRLVPSGLALPIPRGRLRGKRWIVKLGYSYWLGSYEHQQTVLFEKSVQNGTTVFDIGAHVGFYTLLASLLVGLEGKIFAFEPSPKALKFLKRHLELNKIQNVKVIEAAVTDKSGEATFDIGATETQYSQSPQGQYVAKTVCLDELVLRGEISLPHCMKIDVEGAEMQVLEGSMQTLAQARPILFLSTHTNTLYEECSNLLSEMGYQLRNIDWNTIDRCAVIFASPKA